MEGNFEREMNIELSLCHVEQRLLFLTSFFYKSRSPLRYGIDFFYSKILLAYVFRVLLVGPLF